MPTPRSRPVVVYDGQCGFCRRWIERLRRWDRSGRLEFLPLQDATAPVVTGLRRDVLERAVHVVLPWGDVKAGAAAVRALCPFLPGGFLPHRILGLPGVLPLAERAYRWIAGRWGPVGAGAGQR